MNCTLIELLGVQQLYKFLRTIAQLIARVRKKTCYNFFIASYHYEEKIHKEVEKLKQIR